MAYKMKQDFANHNHHTENDTMIARKLNGTRSPPTTNAPPFPERSGSTTSAPALNVAARSKSAMVLKVDTPYSASSPPNATTSPPPRPVPDRPPPAAQPPPRPSVHPPRSGVDATPTNTQPSAVVPQPPRAQGRPLPPHQPIPPNNPPPTQSSNPPSQPVPISRPQPQRPPPQATRQPPQPPQPQQPLHVPSQQTQRVPPPPPQVQSPLLTQPTLKQVAVPKHLLQGTQSSQQPPVQLPPQQPPPQVPKRPPSPLVKPQLQPQSPPHQPLRAQPASQSPRPSPTAQLSHSPRPQPQSPTAQLSQSPRPQPSPSPSQSPSRILPQTSPAPSPTPSPQNTRVHPPQRPPSRVLSPGSQAQSSQPFSPNSQPLQPLSPPGQSPQQALNRPQPRPPLSQPTSPTGASQKLPPKFPSRPLASSAPALTQNVPALTHHSSAPNLPSSRPPPHPNSLSNGASTGNTTGKDSISPRSNMLVRSHSVQLGSGEAMRPGSSTVRKGPPVSPRRATSSVPVRVPLMDRLTEQDIAKIVRVQSYIRGWVLRRKFKKRVKDNIHRTKVVRELLSSEETYVVGLNVINTTYLEQLTWNAKVSPNPLLTQEQINTIFSTVAGIASFNRTLLEKLRERVTLWSPTQVIGDIFLTMAPFLKLYTAYCTNYDQAIQTLQKAKQASNFATFLETCLKSTTHTLDSLLITVVQRIPRYILLLQDFLKHTWPEHVDYTNITLALKSVQDIAEKLNKGIGEAEAQNKVITLQNVIVGIDAPLVKPGRMYVRDGPIAECTLEAKAGKEIEKYWYFLFTDALIITERKKDEKYQLREMVDFIVDISMKIKDVPDNLVVQNAFQIVSPTLSLFLACQDAATKAIILEQTKQFREQVTHRLNLANKPQQVEPPAPIQRNGGGPMMGSELTVTIPRTETCKDGKKEYTLYHTKIRDDQTKKGTIISKRYSEFDHLHKALKKEFPEMDFMDLPKKHLVGSLSKETVESRRVMLEMYLQALVQRPEIRKSDVFKDFISGYTAPPSAKKIKKTSTEA